MSRSTIVGNWKVIANWTLACPQAVVLISMGSFMVVMSVHGLVLRPLGTSPDCSGQIGVFSTALGFLFMPSLMAYYWLPSLAGGLYTFLCLFGHIWSWRQAMAMGSWKWLFVATFLISILYAGYFVWWHFTGQKFGYL